MNALLVSRASLVEQICHHFWVGSTANPPKSDYRYAQLIRGAFIINDFLQNPHLSKNLQIPFSDSLRKIMSILGLLNPCVEFENYSIDFLHKVS